MKFILPLLGFFLLFLFYGAQSQSVNSGKEPTVNSHPEGFICKELKNTYQVQVINTRSMIAYPADLCERIRLNRHKTDTAYIQIYENARVMILPENAIQTKDFPILTECIHIEL